MLNFFITILAVVFLIVFLWGLSKFSLKRLPACLLVLASGLSLSATSFLPWVNTSNDETLRANITEINQNIKLLEIITKYPPFNLLQNSLQNLTPEKMYEFFTQGDPQRILEIIREQREFTGLRMAAISFNNYPIFSIGVWIFTAALLFLVIVGIIQIPGKIKIPKMAQGISIGLLILGILLIVYNISILVFLGGSSFQSRLFAALVEPQITYGTWLALVFGLVALCLAIILSIRHDTVLEDDLFSESNYLEDDI